MCTLLIAKICQVAATRSILILMYDTLSTCSYKNRVVDERCCESLRGSLQVSRLRSELEAERTRSSQQRAELDRPLLEQLPVCCAHA